MKKTGLFLSILLVVAGASYWPSFQNPCSWGRSFAVSRSQDQTVLAEVAVNDTDGGVREAAAAKLTESGSLAKVALEAKDASIRLTAIGEVTDQEVFAKVAKADADAIVRRAAVRRLAVQSVLAEVAVNDTEGGIQEAAVAKLTESSPLAKVALEAKDASIRLTAIGKVTDQKVLAKVAKADADVGVRKGAVGRLTVQSVLAEVAVNDADSGVREAAVKGLLISRQGDLTLLERVAKAAGNEKVQNAAGVRMHAIHRLAELQRRLVEFRNVAELARAAISNGDPAIQYAAVARLSDQTALAKVATEAKDPGVRLAAAARNSDTALCQELLKRLATDVPQIGQELSADLGEGSAVALLWIPPTSDKGFLVGSPANEEGRSDDELQHSVILTKGFWMGKTVVTQAQWETLMESNPSINFKGGDLPVEGVLWDDAMAFCRKLTERERAAGRLPDAYEYTLPTEAQWEYACRAGTTTRFYLGDGEPDLARAAWYSANGESTTHSVGQKQQNSWGLYDMEGNVWEWCLDWYGDYPSQTVTDPTGPSLGSNRVRRGGCWDEDAGNCRSAYRNGDNADDRDGILGFRIVLAPHVSR